MEARRGGRYIVRASGRETLDFPMGCGPRTIDGSGLFTSLGENFGSPYGPKQEERNLPKDFFS